MNNRYEINMNLIDIIYQNFTPYFFLVSEDDMLHCDGEHILSNILLFQVVKFSDHVVTIFYICEYKQNLLRYEEQPQNVQLMWDACVLGINHEFMEASWKIDEQEEKKMISKTNDPRFPASMRLLEFFRFSSSSSIPHNKLSKFFSSKLSFLLSNFCNKISFCRRNSGEAGSEVRAEAALSTKKVLKIPCKQTRVS